MENLLRHRRTDIVKRWVRATLGAYQADAAKFYENEKDPFANPVGTAVSAGIPGLLDALIENAASEEFARRLDRIIQVRSVQDFSPSQAVSFVFLLKNVIRESIAKELRDPGVLADFLSFEERIDRMAACAFDVHSGYRKKISEIRVREARNQVATLLKRSRIGYGDPEIDPNHEDGST